MVWQAKENTPCFVGSIRGMAPSCRSRATTSSKRMELKFGRQNLCHSKRQKTECAEPEPDGMMGRRKGSDGIWQKAFEPIRQSNFWASSRRETSWPLAAIPRPRPHAQMCPVELTPKSLGKDPTTSDPHSQPGLLMFRRDLIHFDTIIPRFGFQSRDTPQNVSLCTVA